MATIYYYYYYYYYFQFSDASQVVDHVSVYLAKFGDIKSMKVENIHIVVNCGYLVE